MAHFAQIDQNNQVQQVIVVSNDSCGGGNFPESEPIGQKFLKDLGFDGIWLQCSYHANFRAAYPGKHWTYNATKDIFEPPVVENIEPGTLP